MDYITELPNELLNQIFRDLSFQQRLKVATVCHRFNDVIRMMEQGQIAMSITPEALSDTEAFTALLQSGREFHAIRIFNIIESDYALSRISRILERFGPNIKELTIESSTSSSTMSPAKLASLIANATSLELLNIRGLNYKYEDVDYAPQPKLRRLDRSFYKTVTSLNLPHLKEVVNLSCDYEYNNILLGLPSNTVKAFRYDGVWPDVFFETFLHEQKSIESLDLNAHRLEFTKLMAHLDLKRLEVHGAIKRDQVDEISQLQSLTELKINRQYAVYPHPEYAKCWNLKNLRKLHLICRGVNFPSPIEPNQQLKKLVINMGKEKFNATSFQRMCDASPHLEHLEIILYPTQEILTSCLTSFPELKYLSVKPPYEPLRMSLLGIDVFNKNLETLIITGASISYGLHTVQLLANSFPNLKHLEVYSEDENEQLEATVLFIKTFLPNLRCFKQHGIEVQQN